MKRTDLKPCPCCGGKADLDSYPGSEWTGSGTYHCVRCSVCYVRTCDFSSANRAVETWNRRTNDVDRKDC